MKERLHREHGLTKYFENGEYRRHLVLVNFGGVIMLMLMLIPFHERGRLKVKGVEMRHRRRRSRPTRKRGKMRRSSLRISLVGHHKSVSRNSRCCWKSIGYTVQTSLLNTERKESEVLYLARSYCLFSLLVSVTFRQDHRKTSLSIARFPAFETALLF